MSGFPADTRAQMALKEMYEKQTLVALKHFLNHNPNFDKEVDSVDDADRKRKGTPAIVAQVVNTKPRVDISVRTRPSLTPKQEKTDLAPQNLSFMRPVSPATREALFGENGRRQDYLKKRYEEGPELRYEQPVTSSMEYGWKVLEMLPNSEMTSPKFAKTELIQDTFFRRGRLSLKVGEDYI